MSAEDAAATEQLLLQEALRASLGDSPAPPPAAAAAGRIPPAPARAPARPLWPALQRRPSSSAPMPSAQEAFVLLEAAKRSGEERAQVLCRLGFGPQVVFHALRLYPDDADAQRDCLLDKLRAATSSSSAARVLLDSHPFDTYVVRDAMQLFQRLGGGCASREERNQRWEAKVEEEQTAHRYFERQAAANAARVARQEALLDAARAQERNRQPRARRASAVVQAPVEDCERAAPASRSAAATMEATEVSSEASEEASEDRERAAQRPYRRCRGGKGKQLKVARKELFKAKRSGNRGRIRVAQRNLALRTAASRDGQEEDSESGPGRRARGGGDGRRPRAASDVGLRHRRRSYLHAGGGQNSSNGPWAALSGSPWAASSNRAGRRQRDHPR